MSHSVSEPIRFNVAPDTRGHSGDNFYRLHIPTDSDNTLKDNVTWNITSKMAYAVGHQTRTSFTLIFVPCGLDEDSDRVLL